MVGKRADHVADPGQGGLEQRRVVIVRAGRDQVQWNAVTVAGEGAFGALFAPVHRAAPGHLTTAGRLGDRPVDGQVLKVQADHPVVGAQPEAQQLLPDAGLGPMGQSSADGAVRAARAGEAFVAAAMDQRGDHMLEHDPVRDPAAVTAPGVGWGELGALVGPDQGGELDPQRLDQGCWQQRHGPSKRSSVVSTPMIRWDPCLYLQRHASNIICR